ncbi:MAG: hypothetical protein AUK24_02200 [Syntrophaceae bacterium CG2_30_49_12]|nr:MAG: hypothetical protein AUK24_02200 [Syntrophaceae bacterium CG2_30_49_12]PIP06655.1 MAG: hypothetical protein COX52_06560 [Syntrophobacterales bacterium CG23_combo_of_CG06-09_8_20_14_all_48_27]PJA50654.1 MAG: universal stress protein [Syntrophobacterales bacterium CG_4_9_14_3_um_filter_49_8]PJC74974.1 MAG: universal stress protein [Syntrophobacterales bacterium CG_4_8_14_3_um_filter_49_14]
MSWRVLVIFENEKVYHDALSYAKELALRMDSEVTLLMLVEMPFYGGSFLGTKRAAILKIKKRTAKVLSECMSMFLEAGIAVSTAIRIGNPAQELIKFLSEKAPFQVVIWGSGKALPGRGQALRNHWLKRIAVDMECPLLTVSGEEI